jgi:uncharacterized protein
MLVVISPAKTINFDNARIVAQHSLPMFCNEASYLVSLLKQYPPIHLMSLMGISDKLAALNHQRYAQWECSENIQNKRQALCAFKGEVYSGIKVDTYSDNDFVFAQQHLLILSGLYGCLRPLDYIMPYRLEMGIKLQNSAGSNLYKFWEHKLTNAIAQHLDQQHNPVLVNLASAEYFSVINTGQIKYPIITPVFKDYHNSKYQIIAIYAKKARGLMTSFLMQNQITDIEQIKAFAVDGYGYNHHLTKGNQWVFTRG